MTRLARIDGSEGKEPESWCRAWDGPSAEPAAVWTDRTHSSPGSSPKQRCAPLHHCLTPRFHGFHGSPLFHLEAKCPQLRRTGIDAGSESSPAALLRRLAHRTRHKVTIGAFRRSFLFQVWRAAHFPQQRGKRRKKWEREQTESGLNWNVWSADLLNPALHLSCSACSPASLWHLDLFLQGSSNDFSLCLCLLLYFYPKSIIQHLGEWKDLLIIVSAKREIKIWIWIIFCSGETLWSFNWINNRCCTHNSLVQGFSSAEK